jgi:hypothetical protein
MHKFSALLAVAALLPSAFAHYNFESLIVNGEATEPYQYVRRTKNANSPVEDVTSLDMVCNVGGIDADTMAATETRTVKAGDQLGFKVNAELGHPGPQAVYMSKAPTTANAYKGDGDWFKIYELTYSEITAEGIQWATWPKTGAIRNFTFTIPEELPAGEYLLRAEHSGLHAAGAIGGAQFYIGCAQINVESSGTGTPAPTVKFPGAYDGTEPGIHINIYYPAPTSYTMYGPATWPNACSDHTPNLDGQTSDGDCTGDDGAAPAPAPSTPVTSPEEPAASSPVAAPSTPANGTEPVIPSESAVAVPPTATTPPATAPSAPVAEPETPVPTAPAQDTEECPTRRRRRALRAARAARAARRARM